MHLHLETMTFVSKDQPQKPDQFRVGIYTHNITKE